MNDFYDHELRGRARTETPALRRDGIAGWVDRLDPATRERLQFFGAFLREPLTVGSLLPSSAVLAEAMIERCDLESSATVVELGPGTGAFTGLILDRLRPEATFFALELNDRHVEGLRRRFPGLAVHNDSAERIRGYLERYGKPKADYVFSGLPWGNFPASLQDQIMTQVVSALSPEGLFVTFAYVHALRLPKARRFRRMLHGMFRKVEQSPVVWRNFPPAVVYRCRV